MRRSEVATESGFAPIDKARIYYEISGDGPPFVMIHAGVADQRQWNNEFTHFSARFRVLRYDMRGYGRSEPADGEYSHLADLTALLDHVNLKGPLILMGCSMGGGLAMNFALQWPSRSRAVIMVDAGPTGLELDVPSPPLAAEAEKAYNAGDLDRVAELETRIWFDGSGRDSTQVDPAMRHLVFDMNRTGLAHDAQHLGKRLPDTQVPAAQRLNELRLPVLVVVGVHDTAYILAAADILVERIRSARKVVLDDAAHLPNLDHPESFQRVVTDFLDALPA
jgi:pimeloyl-ACP methyl ester carboxylesterase